MSILRNKHNGWTWNMERHLNKGDFNPIEIISDAVSSVGDFFADIDPGPAIGQAGSEIDTFVNREIPGGWVAPAAVAAYVATGYFDPSLLAAEGASAVGAAEAAAALEAASIAEGATTAGMVAAANTGLPAGTATLGGVTGAGFVGLDAATAADLGLSGSSGLGIEGAAGDVLAGIPTQAIGGGFAGITPEYATELGLSGSSGLGIEGASGDVLAGIPTGSSGAKDALTAANRARSIASLLTSGQTGGQMGTNLPNMGMPAFEQFGGLYRGNQSPFLVDRTTQVAPLQQTQNFLQQLAEQGKPNDLASLLRNV